MEETFVSDYSGKSFPVGEKMSARLISEGMLRSMRATKEGFGVSSFLAASELVSAREAYLAELLKKQMGELTDLENKVLRTMREDRLTSKSDEVVSAEEDTLGARIADKVAEFGGSWTFILSFLTFLLLWIAVNAFVLLNKGFDPYPFILLNLILSCVAALQAPVIMMSQNRQEEKDRERAKQDYVVNLKAELEVRMLHEKMDHLVMHQQQGLIEIQRVQIDMMNDILARIDGGKGSQ